MRGLTLLVAVATLAAAPAGSSGARESSSKPTGRIAYAPRVYPKDQRIGDNWEIYTVDAAGDGRSLNLTRDGCSEYAPAWAHDGYRIAFVCSDSLVVMRRDTRERRAIRRLRSQRLDDLAWSPDDRQLAFAGARGIWVVNSDGTGLRRLSRGADTSPTWSRDGRTLVFSRKSRGIFQMRTDGTGQHRLAANGDRPAFSPGGAKIAFLGSSGGIWVMDADGGGRRRLPRAGDGHVDVAWSPDGRYLAYQYQHYELHVIALDGTYRRLLPSYGADITGIDWGPNLPS